MIGDYMNMRVIVAMVENNTVMKGEIQWDLREFILGVYMDIGCHAQIPCVYYSSRTRNLALALLGPL
jgi:hypothetical protein